MERIGRYVDCSEKPSPNIAWSLWMASPNADLPPGSWEEGLQNGVDPCTVIEMGQGSREAGIARASNAFGVAPSQILLANINYKNKSLL